jgi:glycerol kinase
MEADTGIRIAELRVDGGGTINDRLMQFQSDILQTRVIRPVVTETTALGAAYLAGLAVGYWSSMEEIQKLWQTEKIFSHVMPEERCEQLLIGWKRAIRASIVWADDHSLDH